MTENRYGVEIEEAGGDWTVHIVEPGGRKVFRRACRDRGEADLFASTVRQHVHWLSPERFRRYYRLPDPS